jgi:16S rRNA (cytidine1402-2'-O)-methyltransferase
MACLYIAGMPIGNEEFSSPLIHILEDADLLVAEEISTVRRITSRLQNRILPFMLVNEHSNMADIDSASELISQKSVSVLISDSGTPCVADPDYRLVDRCITLGVIIRSIPGPSSIITALSVSGFDASKFCFLGFPPKKAGERAIFFKKLKDVAVTTIFLERPYVLEKTVSELAECSIYVSLSISLGTKSEINLRANAADLLKRVAGMKAPFTVVVRKKQTILKERRKI